MKEFIPKPYRKEPVTIRIDTRTLEAIDDIVSLNGDLSRSGLICQCVEYALKNMPPVEQDRAGRGKTRAGRK